MNFEVKISKIWIKSHPNADSLELGTIGSPDGWQVIVRKGVFKTGDLVAYIGENSVVPEWVLKQYGYWDEAKNKGILAGKLGNRVKAKKLRDAFSLGIVIPTIKNGMGDYVWLDTSGKHDEEQGCYVLEGQNVAEILEVTKYEPPIPTQLAGDVFFAGTLVGVNYDVEDFKNYPNVLQEGEQVQVSVKLHGSNLQACWLSPLINDEIRHAVNIEEWIKVWDNDQFLGYVAIASKGLGAKGMFFKDNEANSNNAYLKAFKPHLVNFAKMFKGVQTECATIVSEVFGKGIQQFHYGLSIPEIRVFDLYIGLRGTGHYVDDDNLDLFCNNSSIPRVPVVYRGPFSFEILDKLANDNETEFNCKHVREGVVVKPVIERYEPRLGRVSLKHRSEAYMWWCTGEEFN